MNNKYPNILIISPVPFSENSSARTLNTFFKDWDRKSIAQIYFHLQKPNSNLCNNYYQITDVDMLKSFFKKSNIGTIHKASYFENKQNDEPNKYEGFYKFGKRKLPFIHFGRDFIWNKKKWKNEKFDNWVSEFNPDIIFFDPIDYTYAYEIAFYISKTRNIPILNYICDDYYFNDKHSFSPLYHFVRYKFKKTFDKLMKYSTNSIYICDMINEKYSSYFNHKGVTIMTTSEMLLSNKNIQQQKNKVSYLGNVSLDRWKNLVEIGKTLQKISPNLFLNIYSNENREEITRHLNVKNGILFNGKVTYEKVKEVMYASELLIHTENFEQKNINITKYSVSTKIADSLSCGTCLFAYGPKEIASMDYLIQNDVARVVSEKQELENGLTEIIKNKEMRQKYVDKALIVASQFHNKEINSRKFTAIVNKIVSDWSGKSENFAN